MSHSTSTVPSRRGLFLVVFALIAAVAGGGLWHVRAAINDTPPSHAANDGSDVGILLGLADSAYREGRLVAPVGSNVYEFYFSVLQLDPHDAIAEQRLRDAFKPACDVVENTINAGDLDEAQRELLLLRMYDRHNYKLALLGGVLDAQRVLQSRRHEAEAARIRARQAAGQDPR